MNIHFLQVYEKNCIHNFLQHSVGNVLFQSNKEIFF